jgi:hypothetical protein
LKALLSHSYVSELEGGIHHDSTETFSPHSLLRVGLPDCVEYLCHAIRTPSVSVARTSIGLPGQLASELLVFLVFLVSILAQTVLMTWVYNNTGGSLLRTTLFHFSSDAFLTFFLPTLVPPSDVPLIFAIMTLLQVGVAILVVVNYGPAHLSRQPKKTATVSMNAERERGL